MKKFGTLFLLALGFGLSSQLFSLPICFEIKESCQEAELPGCEGGYGGYDGRELEYFLAGFDRQETLLECLNHVNKIENIGRGLHCQEVPNNCHIQESFGCQGGYKLFEVELGSYQFFSNAVYESSLEACIKSRPSSQNFAE